MAKPAARGRLPGRIADLGLDVEILVNNAGFATNGAFHESDPERELEQVRVLVEAVVALSSAFIPAMVDRGRGAVLNVASTAAMQPLPYSAGYSAAKAYVLTFSEALHQELHGRGVTVTALCPGPVSTDFWQISGWEVQGGKTFEQAVPQARLDLRQGRRPCRSRRTRGRAPRGRARAADPRRDGGHSLPPARDQVARDRVADAAPVSELLPRPIRLLIGATSAAPATGSCATRSPARSCS